MATQKEDVYETEDIPETPNEINDEDFHSADIEKLYTDVDGALKKFGGRLLDASNADFSDSILPRRRKGYGSGQYVLEVIGPNYDEPETPEQKLNRIRCEINELQQSVEQSKDVPTTISKNDLDELNDMLKAALTTNPEIKKKVDADKSRPQRTPASAELADVNQLTAFDTRLKRIEHAVTGERAALRPPTAPLLETIEDLKLRVETLNPAYLDSVHSKLNAVMTKLSEYDEKKNKINGEDVEKKVDKLYEMVLKWDATCTNVPSLVKRLQSLSKLHEQAEEFSTQLSEMGALRQQMEKRLESDRMTLFEVKKESAKLIEDLNKKISEMESKFA
jgi:dynactin-2